MEKSPQGNPRESGAPSDARLRSLETILAHSPAVIFVWRVADGWPVEFVTPNCRQFGYSAEDFLSGRVSWPGITHPDDLARLEAETAGYLARRVDSFEQHYRLITRSGEARSIADHTSVVRDADGSVTHFQGVILDVTDRVRADEALRVANERYRAIVESAGETIAVVDGESRFLFVNSTAAKRLGRRADEVVGRTMGDIFPPEIAQRQSESVRRCIVTGQDGVYETWTEVLGQRRWYRTSLSPIRDADGSVGSVLIIGRDATAQVEQAQALARSEERYRTLMENAGDGIIVHDALGRVLDANPAALAIVRLPRERVIGAHLHEFVPPGETGDLGALTRRVLAGETLRVERQIQRGDGSPAMVEVASRVLPDGTIVIVGRDITERQAAQQALQRSYAEVEAKVVERTAALRAEMDERRRVADALCRSEEQYRLLSELTSDMAAMASVDPTGNVKVEWVSPSCGRVLGYSAGDLQAFADWRQLCHAEDLGFAGKLISVVLAGEEVVGEYRMLTKRGEVRWMRHYARPVRDAATGRVASVVSALQDVTARRRAEDEVAASRDRLRDLVAQRTAQLEQANRALAAEAAERRRVAEALAESETNFRTMAENAAEGIVVEAAGLIVYANDNLARMVKRPVTEIIGSPSLSIIAPADRDRVDDISRRRFAGERLAAYTVDLNAGDGARVFAEISGALTSWGGTPATLGMVRDITERQRAYEALRRSEERLAAAQRVARIGSWDWNMETNETVWSAEMYQVLHIDPARFAPDSERVWARVPPADRERVQAVFAERTRNGMPYAAEHGVVGDDGVERTVSARGEITVDATGARHFLGTLVDVTEQRLAGEALARSQEELRRLARALQRAREEERAAIAKEVHDELGQALTAIKLDLHWVRQKSSPQAAVAERLTEMIGLTDTSIQAVKRLAAELKPALLEDEGLSAAVEWHLGEFRKRTGIATELEMDVPVDIDGDRRLAVFRVFQESLTNVARHAEATRVKVRLVARDGCLRLCVRDNGKGLPREKVLDPGSTGLSGMRERVRAFGGRIRVTGVGGKGTVVCARFPREPGAGSKLGAGAGRVASGGIS